jgi:hypothetical protein
MQYDKLENYIYVVKNALSLNLCNEILNEFKNSDDWEESTIATGKVQKDVRSCEIIGISFPQIIQKNNEIRHKLDNEIFIIIH